MVYCHWFSDKFIDQILLLHVLKEINCNKVLYTSNNENFIKLLSRD